MPRLGGMQGTIQHLPLPNLVKNIIRDGSSPKVGMKAHALDYARLGSEDLQVLQPPSNQANVENYAGGSRHFLAFRIIGIVSGIEFRVTCS